MKLESRMMADAFLQSCARLEFATCGVSVTVTPPVPQKSTCRPGKASRVHVFFFRKKRTKAVSSTHKWQVGETYVAVLAACSACTAARRIAPLDHLQ